MLMAFDEPSKLLLCAALIGTTLGYPLLYDFRHHLPCSIEPAGVF